MSQTCQRCYQIVTRTCQSDTEAEDCKNLRRPSYAVCSVGEGYSVENRRTGERASYHASWGAATAAVRRLERGRPPLAVQK